MTSKKLPPKRKHPRPSRVFTRRTIVGLAGAAGVAGLAAGGFVALGRRGGDMTERIRFGFDQERQRLADRIREQADSFEAAAQSAPEVPAPSRVVKVSTAPHELAAGLERALLALTGEANVRAAWLGLVSPTDRVGVKVGSLQQGVVDAAIRGLISAGIPAARIAILDLPTTPAWRPPATVEGVALDSDMSSDAYSIGVQRQRIARGLESCTALLNLAGLNSHDTMRVTGALKNHMGSVEQPHELHLSFEYSCALLNSVEPIRDKTRLVILDALRPNLWGHPDFPQPRFSWDASALVVSRDPVAADAVGLDLVREGSLQLGLPDDFALADATLANAARLGLGNCDREKIELVEVS